MKDLVSPLSTVDVEAICRAHPVLARVHYGTFPMDMLPADKDFKRPVHFCVNTDPSTLPGQHWISIYSEGKRHAEVMNSLGGPPLKDPRLTAFLARLAHGNKAVTNTQTLQDGQSVACGLYVLSHAFFRAAGMPFRTWLARFAPQNLTANTRRVQCDFIKRYGHRGWLTPAVPRATWVRWMRAACGTQTCANRQEGNTSQHGRRSCRAVASRLPKDGLLRRE